MPIITHAPKKRKKKTMHTGRVSTGIHEYDLLMNGGFFKDTLNLISGPSGSGKTLFCMTYLYNNALKGKNGAYITIEEDADQIRTNCLSLGMDIAKAEEHLLIMDIPKLRKFYTNKEEIYDENSLLDVDNLIDLIKRNCQNMELLVIDSIVPLSMRYKYVNEFRTALFRLKLALKELGVTAVITTETKPGQPEAISKFDIEDFISDSVTILKMGEFEKDITNWYSDKHFSERFMRIHKLRGSDHVKSYVEYRITSDGIKIFAPSSLFR